MLFRVGRQVVKVFIPFTPKSALFQIANGYKVNALQGRWFLAPVEALELDKSSFAVFLFLQSCSNKKGRCFPSLTKIMAALHLACHTVIEAIRALVELGLVVKGAFWPGRHNLYLVKLKQAKKKTPTAIGAQTKTSY